MQKYGTENVVMTSREFSQDPDFLMQIVIVGDYSVGKTTTLRHVACDKNRSPIDVYCPMSVTTSMMRTGKEVIVKIVDTGGKSMLF